MSRGCSNTQFLRDRIEMPRRNHTYECRHCGEVVNAVNIVQWNRCCQDCFEELHHGTIPKVTDSTLQSHASHLTPRQREALGRTDS